MRRLDATPESFRGRGLCSPGGGRPFEGSPLFSPHFMRLKGEISIGEFPRDISEFIPSTPGRGYFVSGGEPGIDLSPLPKSKTAFIFSGFGRQSSGLERSLVSTPKTPMTPKTPTDRRTTSQEESGTPVWPKAVFLEKTSEKSLFSQAGDSCCSCKKSRCIKLYCECFARGNECGSSCGCQSCLNIPQYSELKKLVVKEIVCRNPQAFLGRATPQLRSTRRACRCKKTACSKKYCECVAAGLPCTAECRCCDCSNGKPGDSDHPSSHCKPKKRKKNFIETLSEKLELVRQLQRAETTRVS